MGKVKRVKDFYPPCEKIGTQKGDAFECSCKTLVRQCFGLRKKGMKEVEISDPNGSRFVKTGSSCARAVPNLFRDVERVRDIEDVKIDGKHALTEKCRDKAAIEEDQDEATTEKVLVRRRYAVRRTRIQ